MDLVRAGKSAKNRMGAIGVKKISHAKAQRRKALPRF